jgi:succinate dehydrogenase / fumarate reductase cytochrome b subunit
VGQRPVDLNLLRIRLPVSGWVSILHRVTGVVLFLALPLAVWLLSRSLAGEAGFRQVSAYLAHPLAKLALLALAWAFAHHLFAGLRHLALDVHRGVGLEQARRSGVAVLLAGGVVALLVAWGLFA